MNEIQIQKSELTLDRIFFDECTFVRKSDDVGDEKGVQYDVNFVRDITWIDDEHYRVSLRCNAFEKKTAAIEIHVRVVAEFQVSTDDEHKKNILVTKNTMAILFPYLRSQVILLTSQIGCPMLVLPVVNIAAMFPDVELPTGNGQN